VCVCVCFLENERKERKKGRKGKERKEKEWDGEVPGFSRVVTPLVLFVRH